MMVAVLLLLFARAEALALRVDARALRVFARAEALALRTLDGREVDPFAGAQRATAFVFVRPDCPVSRRYAPELNRLYEAYRSRDIRMWLVYPGREDAATTIREHHREFALAAPALRDPRLALANLAGATMTPEAAVFAGDRLVYRGRIDDRAVRPGVWRGSAGERDLDGVLDRLARDERVVPFTTRAVGCYITPAH